MIANLQGVTYLARDAGNVAAWFTARGPSGVDPAPTELGALLRYEAHLD